MPEGVIYVGRPTRWGNPFVAGGRIRLAAIELSIASEHPPVEVLVHNSLEAIAWYRVWALRMIRVYRDKWQMDWLEGLPGHDLACWCPLDKPCHVDVLLELLATQ